MNPENIGEYLEQYTFDYFIEKALEQVDEGIDKREGSIIYDALAPSCYQLALVTLELKNILTDSFVLTASGMYLDLKANEHGISRNLATKAIVKARFKDGQGNPYTTLENGQRFSSIGDDPVYYQVYSDQPESGVYLLQAETAGSKGNQYVGELLPLDNFNNLGDSLIIEVTFPARDDETDDSLRERVLKTYEVNNFGGNIEDYIHFTQAIQGVGAVQVYPTWNGGGTVKVVILSSSYDIPTQTLLNNVQNQIDPSQNQEGYGIAPIGHQVTVASPTKVNLNVGFKIDTIVGVDLEQIKTNIESALRDHFLAIRKTWSQHNELYQYQQIIYRSQLIATLLKVNGVANVSDVTLAGKSTDYVVATTKEKQEVVFLGTIEYK